MTAHLVIIDMQVDAFQGRVLTARRPELVTTINELVAAFREHGSPITWVRQEFKDLDDAFLDMRRRHQVVTIAGTEGAALIPELDYRDGDRTVVKRRYSVFFGTAFEQILVETGSDLLVIAGVNSHACVRTTIIDAYQRDIPVVVPRDGVASYDPEFNAVTTRYLDGRMAEFLPSAEILERLSTGQWQERSFQK